MPHYLFPTPIGTCAIAWTDKGISGLQLPERSELATEQKLAARVKSEKLAAKAPPFVMEAVRWVHALLAGKEPGHFKGRLDWDLVSEFRQKVYHAALRIPEGRTRTYGEIAEQLGLKPGASRAVGQALGANPWPLLVPCHRVIGADGKLTGFSAHGGVATKARILAIEDAELPVQHI